MKYIIKIENSNIINNIYLKKSLENINLINYYNDKKYNKI